MQYTGASNGQSSRCFSVRSFFILSALILVIPIYMMGFSLYKAGLNNVRNKTYDTIIQQVKFYLATMEADIISLQEQMFDLAEYQQVASLVFRWDYMSMSERNWNVLNIQSRLRSIRYASQYVKTVDVFLHSLDMKINDYTGLSQYSETDKLELAQLYEAEWNHNISLWRSGYGVIATFPAGYKITRRLPVYTIVAELDRELLNSAISVLSHETEEVSVLTNQQSILATSGDGAIVSQITKDRGLISGQVTVRTYDHTPYVCVLMRSSRSRMEMLYAVPEQLLFGDMHKYTVFFVWYTLSALMMIGLVTLLMSRLFHRPLHGIAQAMKRFETGDYSVRLNPTPLHEFNQLMLGFNSMAFRIHTLIEEDYMKTILTQEAELKQLQYQIDPHFLYNCFFLTNSLAVEEDYETLAQLSKLMGGYFKYITRADSMDIALEQEAEHAHLYAQIQGIRFAPRIQVHVDAVPDSVRQLTVPRLILQPLLENAFLHGTRDIEEGGLVMMCFILSEKRLSVIVEDNGPSLSPQQLNNLTKAIQDDGRIGDGVALQNIHRRIRLRFGSGGIVLRKSRLSGLSTELVIPLQNKKGGEAT